jgi:hypothetical protein
VNLINSKNCERTVSHPDSRWCPCKVIIFHIYYQPWLFVHLVVVLESLALRRASAADRCCCNWLIPEKWLSHMSEKLSSSIYHQAYTLIYLGVEDSWSLSSGLAPDDLPGGSSSIGAGSIIIFSREMTALLKPSISRSGNKTFQHRSIGRTRCHNILMLTHDMPWTHIEFLSFHYTLAHCWSHHSNNTKFLIA